MQKSSRKAIVSREVGVRRAEEETEAKLIDEHVTEFAGKPVREWNAKEGIADPATYNYRIMVEYEDSQRWTDKFAAFLEDPNAAEVTGLVIGNWGEVASGDDPATEVVEALTVARDR